MERNEKVTIMQHNLLHIRKSLKLSAKEFGELIGVTRQTINNIEYGRNKLTITQYLAIMYVLDNEIFPNLSEDETQIIHKLLECKVTEQNYINSLRFEEL